MTTPIGHAVPGRPRAAVAVPSSVLALVAAVAVLVGWAAPLGAQAAPARLSTATASGASVGQVPSAAVRASRSAVVTVAARASQPLTTTQRVVSDGSGGAPLLLLVALIAAAFGMLALRAGARSRPVELLAVRPAPRTGHRDRAPPVRVPATA